MRTEASIRKNGQRPRSPLMPTERSRRSSGTQSAGRRAARRYEEVAGRCFLSKRLAGRRREMPMNRNRIIEINNSIEKVRACITPELSADKSRAPTCNKAQPRAICAETRRQEEDGGASMDSKWGFMIGAGA